MAGRLHHLVSTTIFECAGRSCSPGRPPRQQWAGFEATAIAHAWGTPQHILPAPLSGRPPRPAPRPNLTRTRFPVPTPAGRYVFSLPYVRTVQTRGLRFPVRLAYDGPGDRLSVSAYNGLDQTITNEVGRCAQTRAGAQPRPCSGRGHTHMSHPRKLQGGPGCPCAHTAPLPGPPQRLAPGRRARSSSSPASTRRSAGSMPETQGRPPTRRPR